MKEVIKMSNEEKSFPKASINWYIPTLVNSLQNNYK